MPQGNLFDLLSAPARPGRVVWIGLRPGRRTMVMPVDQAALDPVAGLAGDHYTNRNSRSRQVTLIAEEALHAIAAYLGRPGIEPGMMRRNIVMAGINPHALKSRNVRIGSAELQITGECHPCSRMEEIFGPGGYNAVRGHGGLTARIVAGGIVRIGDPIIGIIRPSSKAEQTPPAG
ncbi:MAG TPA: MOSC domain-containing protein [Rhodopila sp.]|nr:MOSC domain-containing protein [Rhodopila sp.]